MTFLLYFFAGIGGVVVSAVLLVIGLWLWSCYFARFILRRRRFDNSP